MIEEIALQRTPEWYQARCGRATASRIVDIITRTRNGWGHARAKYLDQLVAERLCGRPQDMRRIKSLDDRADLEPEARAAYSFYTDNEIELVGFIPHPTIENAGASPDGLVNSDGMLEIKALDAANHHKLFAGDLSPLEDYLPQVHFGMACTERKWCDLVAYCPIMPEELKMFRQPIQRDDDLITRLESAVKEFLAEVDAKVAMLMEKTR